MFRIVFFITISIFIFSKATRTNFNIKHFETCNNTLGIIKFSGRVTVENGYHYLPYRVISPIYIDDKIGIVCLIQTKLGNSFVDLFTIREKNVCKAANIYLGEFWYDIERAAQLPPGVCPIPPGRYNIHHWKLNFEKITLQTFPFGRLRFVVNLIDNTNASRHIWCVLLEVENAIN